MTDRKENRMPDGDVTLIAVALLVACIAIGAVAAMAYDHKLGLPALPPPNEHSILHRVN